MPRPRQETPQLVERENGIWYVQWNDDARRRLIRESLGTRNHTEAVRLYAEFLLGGQARRARSDDSLTISQALEDYWTQHVTAEDEKGRTQVVDTQRVRYALNHLKGYFGDRMIKDIGPAECRGYTAERRKTIALRRGTLTRDSTIRKELAFLTAAANHAVRWKALARADLPIVEMPRIERPAPKWFTKTQIQRLLAETSGDLQHFIRIAYYTAGRRRSIERLTRFQVKLEEGVIYLQPPDGRVTKKRRPAVPIFPEIRTAVTELCSRADGENAYIFGGATKSFYQGFVEACEKIGVPGGHPHMLRHSRASHMLQDGEDIWRVARILGDTVATVEAVYAHCLPHHLLTESNAEAIPFGMT